MGVSAVMIMYNEEELLPSCLAFLNSMTNIAEIICVIDDATNDRTEGIISRYKSRPNAKKLISTRQPYSNFSEMRNLGIGLATEPWILSIDTDMTFSPQLDVLMADINKMSAINIVQIPKLELWPDRRHHLSVYGSDSWDIHPYLYRKDFAKYEGIVHEELVDIHGRRHVGNLISDKDEDVLHVTKKTEYEHIYMKHHQLLKSDTNLAFKGLRWQQIGAIKASNEKGLIINPQIWYERKKWAFLGRDIISLPLHLYDVTSDW